VSGIGQTMIDLLPGPSVDIVVATAETKDKAILRAALGASTIGTSRLAAGLERLRHGRGQALLLSHGVIAGAGAASRPENSVTASLVTGAAAGMVGAGTLAAVNHRPSESRERLIIAAGTLALTVAGAIRQRQRSRADHRRQELILPAPARPAAPLPRDAELEVPGITPLYTSNQSFYVTDTALSVPGIDARGWRLRVHGLVERELEFSLKQLLDLELVEVDGTLVCVHNPVGGHRVGGARWLGVPLSKLLSAAGVRSGCDQVVTHSVTGFSAGLPVEMVTDSEIPLVALAMNGEPLTVRNGFPARVLTPGIWGADANTKWLSAIELTTWDQASDYWDARGWPRTPGAVTPGSRIDVPSDHSMLVAGAAIAAGVAWAPRGGVSRVEVAIDGGPWQTAQLSANISPMLWRQWMLRWHAQPGEHEIQVRTHSGDEVQAMPPAPPYPHGSSGYHTIRVHVRDNGALPPRWQPRFARARANLNHRVRLAAMAPPAWRRYGFPRGPTFDESLPPARRDLRQLLPSRA
jgi:DMSO/TMAO reductase YedYZ molybdopterin-dependent catalytic subunit